MAQLVVGLQAGRFFGFLGLRLLASLGRVTCDGTLRAYGWLPLLSLGLGLRLKASLGRGVSDLRPVASLGSRLEASCLFELCNYESERLRLVASLGPGSGLRLEPSQGQIVHDVKAWKPEIHLGGTDHESSCQESLESVRPKACPLFGPWIGRPTIIETTPCQVQDCAQGMWKGHSDTAI